MGTMAASKHFIEKPSSDNGRTRPRPPPSDGETLRMEAIHAEFLDNYHREAHQQSEEDEDIDHKICDHKSRVNVDGFRLSETPDTVTEELKATLCEGHSSRYNKKRLSRTESVDRRLNETARFFQAVGETPPTSQSDIQTIIEDQNSDSDSDDDAGTVHVIDGSESENIDLSFEYHLSKPSLSSSAPIPLKKLQQSKSSQSLVSSPTSSRVKRFHSIFHQLPSSGGIRSDEFQYRGIPNPPEITQRGVSRGNYALLHRKAWLEVSDERHRYGKNLRLYYRKWESLGHPSNDFFDWLDSKGASAGQPLPELAECPRSELDSDTVLYIQDSEVTKRYALSLVCDRSGNTRILDANDEPVCTGPDGWIFVLRDNVLYGAEKITSVTEHSRQRFHHSSFFGGKAVAAAGIFITDQNGVLTRVLPHSGHYRPGEADMQRMVFFLYNEGADLRLIEVDTQQLNHINRKDPNTFRKKAKKDSLHLCSAATVAHFLSNKAHFIGQGIFSQVHKIKNMKNKSVKEALREIDAVEDRMRDID